MPPVLPEGRTSLPVDDNAPPGFYEAVGFHVLGSKAVRVDMLERFGAEVRRLSREKVAILPPNLFTLLGTTVDEAPIVLAALGYDAQIGEDGIIFKSMSRRRRAIHAGKRSRHRKATAKRQAKHPHGTDRSPSRKDKDIEDSPFAVLRDLVTITA